MGTCRICQQECSQDQQVCSNCGYLFPVTPTLDENSPSSPEVLSQREAWEKEIWQKHEKFKQQYKKLSQNYQQLQQKFNKLLQKARNYKKLQQQIDQLKQENTQIHEQLESHSQFQQSQQQAIEQMQAVLQETQCRHPQKNTDSSQQIQKQFSEIQQEIADFWQENIRLHHKLEAQTSSQQQGEVPLESAVGYDYTRLRDLLAEYKWREADKETKKAMLKVASKAFLRVEDIENFPYEDLQTIDRLWVKSSNGKFGFSVQGEIYWKLGSTKKFHRETWKEFCNIVGWRENRNWKLRNELDENLGSKTPKGHYPCGGEFSDPQWGMVMSALLSKMQPKPKSPSMATPSQKPSQSKQTSPSPSPATATSASQVELRSAAGYDYTQLRDLLAAGKWKEADEETANAILKVAGRNKFLRVEDIDNFPCEDLRTIDRLWVKSSNGKFGFSVQKEIYQKLGGTRKFDLEIWEKFGDTVGWRDNDGRWIVDSKLENWRRLTRDNTPGGHLSRYVFHPPFVPVLGGTSPRRVSLLSRRDL